LVTSILAVYGNGVFYYGFSTFVKPIVQELAWSMTVVSGAFSIYRLEAGIAAPVVGYLLDRIGPQKLVFAGGLVMGSGFIALSRVHNVLPFYAAIIIISCGWSAFSGSAVGNPLVGRWFVKKRGVALGLYNAATGLAGLIVPVVAYMIVHCGWRSTLFAMGFLTWLIVLPFSFFLKHSPEKCGLLPDGDPSPTVDCDDRREGETVKAAEVDFSLRKSVSTSAFWILTACFFIHQIVQSTVFVHLIPYLIDLGIPATSSASVVTVIALASIASRYGFGWLGDRFNKKSLLLILFILQPIALFSLARASTLLDIIPFVVFYSIGYGGTVVVKATITGDYYGRQNFGTIFGAIQGISTFGGIAGPLAAGLVYDVYGSYHMAFVAFAVMMALTAILITSLKRPFPA